MTKLCSRAPLLAIDTWIGWPTLTVMVFGSNLKLSSAFRLTVWALVVGLAPPPQATRPTASANPHETRKANLLLTAWLLLFS